MTAPTQPPDKCPADGLDIDDWMVLAQHYQGELLKSEAAAIALRAERDAALARAEKAEAQRDVYTGLYLFANQQHEQQETELQRYKEIMPCGHARMLEILNDGQMPECSVCWLARTEADRNALTARLAELQAVRDAAIAWREVERTHGNVSHIKHMHNLIVAVDALAALASGPESD